VLGLPSAPESTVVPLLDSFAGLIAGP